jgi:hypothetical protein
LEILKEENMLRENHYLCRELSTSISITKRLLKNNPSDYIKVESLLKELERRLETDCTDEWLYFQLRRLARIRWLLDASNNGITDGMVICMRPYDISWLICLIGKIACLSRDEYNKQANGGINNAEKILLSPDVKIVFTNKFADFCYMCNNMRADGCILYKDNQHFPYGVQMTEKDKQGSTAALQLLGLNWNDEIIGRELLVLCAERGSEPTMYTGGGWSKKSGSFEYFRKRIEEIKNRFSLK